MVEINGIAHIALTVNRFELCAPFYEELLSFLGLKRVFKGQDNLYYVGGKTAVGISRAHAEHQGEPFIQTRIGLHHLCFRARSREDVDSLHRHLLNIKAKIVHPPENGPWGPGYYSVLFEDPDGIRLEMNYVEGKGVLAEGAKFDPAGDYS